ncbi:MAG: glycosyltransferase [Geodermatophilaceae bacterium]|jgi:alpha-1,6-mannosyltransferase
MSRIVQVANFVAPHSGGLRTALDRLAAGYNAHGYDVVQVIPGRSDSETPAAWGTRVTLRAPAIPGTGYRMFTGTDAVTPMLTRLRPYRLEVHDRATLRGLGTWAARRDVRSLVVSHERLDRLLAQWLPTWLPLRAAADRSNRALAAGFDAVVCTTGWAAEEFTRLGTPNLHCVPLGVDLRGFDPGRATASVRAALASPDEALLLLVSRLSREKRPGLAIEAVRELARRGRRSQLVVAGDGPLRRRLQVQAADLPVRFLGFVAEADRLAGLLSCADVFLAPGPVETFGLAALEALASGTPVVANAASALPEVLGSAGVAAAGTAAAFADAVETLLDTARHDARARAELFPWSTTITGFLAAHGITATTDKPTADRSTTDRSTDRRPDERTIDREHTTGADRSAGRGTTGYAGGRPGRQPQLR